MNIGVHRFFWINVSGFSEYNPISGITGSKGSSIFSFFFWGNSILFSTVAAPVCIPPTVLLNVLLMELPIAVPVPPPPSPPSLGLVRGPRCCQSCHSASPNCLEQSDIRTEKSWGWLIPMVEARRGCLPLSAALFPCFTWILSFSAADWLLL